MRHRKAQIRYSVFALVLLGALPGLTQSVPNPLANARLLLTQGQLTRSEALLRGYLQDHPSSADAHFLLGYALFREQHAKDSLAEFTAGAKFQRPGADDLKVVASDYVMLSDFEDADKWFSAVVTEKPNDPETWYLLGRTKYNENDFANAVRCFQRALSLRPIYIEAENNLGLTWKELNENEQARRAFQTAIDWQRPTPTDAQPFLNLGELYADQEQFQKALPLLIEAKALAPANPTVHEQLAAVYSATGDLPKAQEELEKATALAPQASGLHFKLGQIYHKEGLADRARQEFDLCAKLNSTHSSAKTPNPISKTAATE